MATKKAQPKQPAERGPPWTWRSSVVVAVAVVIGLGFGALGTLLLPEGGLLAAERARHHLAKDTAEGLRDAVAIADGDAGLTGVAVLARVLLWAEHGAGDDVRAAAEKALQKASPPQRITPEMLYARAILAGLPPERSPVVDGKLDEDLRAAREDVSWVHLARGLRADGAERRAHVERAALGRNPRPHATHQLAKLLLQDGDLAGARAALTRLFALEAEHAPGAITALVVGALEAVLTPERRAKPERKKNEGPARPGQGSGVLGPDEVRVLALLDAGLDELDEGVLAVAALAFSLARGPEVDERLAKRVMAAAAGSATCGERALELFLLEGDVDGADGVVRSQKAIERLSLLVDVSRARFLRAIPDEQRRAAIKAATRGVDADGIRLPLGRLVFDASAWGHPWTARPDPSLFAERRYLQLESAVAAGGARDRLDARLAVIEKLRLAERALDAGDLGGALTLVQQARDQTGADADVSLTEAAIRARQNDPQGLKAAVDAAVAAAPDDPRVLLTAARLHVEVENFIGARKALNAFRRLGLKSAPASAIEALLEARAGDVAAARAAVAEARRLGGDDVLTLRATIHAARTVDPGEARAAADELVKRNDVGGDDVVGAWRAEAWYRAGDQPRAEAALQAILAARPGLGEAHLFFARAIAFNPARKKEAYAHALSALDKIERGPLVDEAKKLALSLKARR